MFTSVHLLRYFRHIRFTNLHAICSTITNTRAFFLLPSSPQKSLKKSMFDNNYSTSCLTPKNVDSLEHLFDNSIKFDVCTLLVLCYICQRRKNKNMSKSKLFLTAWLDLRAIMPKRARALQTKRHPWRVKKSEGTCDWSSVERSGMLRLSEHCAVCPAWITIKLLHCFVTKIILGPQKQKFGKLRLKWECCGHNGILSFSLGLQHARANVDCTNYCTFRARATVERFSFWIRKK